MVLARILIIVLLIGPAAASHVNTNDVRWACGGGGQGQTGHPDQCGIDAVNDPTFGANWLQDDERVLGVTWKGEARAYPVKMLNAHEIVNDEIQGENIAVTFCPLCGSGVSFLREERMLEASGFLYQHDMVMYDQSGTLWNQITGEAIGTLVDRRVEPGHDEAQLQIVPTIITTMAQWQSEYGENVLQPVRAAGSYREHAYGTYETNCNFGISGESNCDVAGIHPKEQMATLQLGESRAWPLFGLIQEGVLLDEVGNVQVALAAKFGGEVRAYNVTDMSLTFQDPFYVDRSGRMWDLASGEQVDGEGTLQELPVNVMFWFAWQLHHPDTTVWWPESDEAARDKEQAFAPFFWMLLPVAVIALWRRYHE